MSDKLNFDLPKQKQKSPGLMPVIVILLSALIVLGIANLILTGMTGGRGSAGGKSPLSAEKQKELALRLQKRSLHDAAADAWLYYLDQASLSPAEKANIWYSMGKLYQEAGRYEDALAAYFTSESIAEQEELQDEIGRRVQECLESLGKFAALRYELLERVGMEEQKGSGDEVVAQIGPEKITRSDLDRKIEQYIELAISQYASFMSPEQLTAQKEELFKQFSGEEGRMKILNQYIIEEILYRKAREEKLGDDPKTRALIKETEKQILAQQLLSKRIAEKISLTESDLENHYTANRAKYIVDGVQKSFEEVRSDVYRDLRAQKEGEVQQALIAELRQLYDVVLYPSRLSGAGGGGDEK